MKGRNMNKRVISLLLVFCMILGLFPATTYAAEQSSAQVVSSEMLSSETQEEKSENTAGENELGNSTLEEDNEEEKEADESIAGSENNSSVTVEPSQEESKSTADENELEDSALKEDSDSSSKAKVKDAPLQEKLSKNVAIMSLEAGTADSGVTFELSRINVQAEKAGVYELAQAQFEAKGKNVSLVYNEVTSVNDIIVNPKGNSDTYGEEGYSITVDSGVVTVTAATNVGAFYGLQNVLQQIEKGDVSDVEATQPYKGTRSLFVDCGRKYFSVSWFEEMIREMAWNGMNTLYLSFSNDEGFRFLLDDMSLSFDDGNGNTIKYDDEFMSHLADNPQYLTDSAFLTERNNGASNVAQQIANYDNNKYLSQKDMERILAYAEAYGINVIPEFNSPGHMGQVLWYFPEYRNVGIWGVGSNPCYALNLANVEAKNFATALIKKYVDFFATNGVEDFCVGGDEFASHGSSNETIASYVNNLVDYVESKGMTAYAWNDGQATASGLLKKSVVVNCWNGSAVDGYSCVNFNGNSFNTHTLYYVLKGHDGWRPDAEWLYSTWTPLDFYGATVANSDKIAGASLAVWCDNPNYETSDEVLANMIPNIRAFGYKMWNYSDVAKPSLPDEYASYSEFTAAATNAPEVEEKTVLATVDYVITEDEGNDDNENTPLPAPTPEGIGYELVTFGEATVSTTDGWWNDGNSLIDGYINTFAWTYGSQEVGDYMRVDLGSVQTIDSITITSPADGDVCASANVQVSLDGVQWTNVGTHSGNSESIVSDTYNINDEIRYIQIVITKPSGNWWKVSEISWSPKTTNTIEDGTYIIVNGTNKAMTHNESGSGFAKKDVTISKNIATPVDSVYEWTFEKQNDGTYYITDSDGAYLNISGSGISTSNIAQKITITISGGKVQLSDNGNCINFYGGHDPQIFGRWNSGTGDANNMQTLYKKLTDGLRTVDLYNLITEAQKIDNSDQRYGTAEFERLQSILTESIELYNDASATETTVTQEQIDEQTEKLQTALSELMLSDTTGNYIEIPVEILDFRADGVLFEYDQNGQPLGAYDLLKPWASDYAELLPGTAASQEGYDSSEVWRRQGLTEENLVDGNLVYTQATVEYVAALINARYYSDLTGTEDSYNDWTHSTVTNWNTNISNKVKEVAGNLGTWADTIAKTSSQANGSYLAWNDITTSTDLAYYVLTNLYRTTESDGTTQYNTKVSSVDRIRMLYDESTGLYTLDANYQTETTGGYVFNTDLTTGTSNYPGNFNPIKDLGYEGSDYTYGDTTDAVHGQNFHFTMHAYGSFVYYADQDLYFEFTGDDDVYFYIDGKLAMDIGAAHGPCSDGLRLNDVADDLGLVDGGIYTFDMFYAERHTIASNLKFATNIKIMDTMSTTSKSQYKEATGETIPYGSIVEEGTTVAYSFELLNLRSVNIIDISFIDESLGSNLSKNGITLYDSAKTNGAETNITDITVYYNTYDRPAPNQSGTINSSLSEDKTFADMVAMINAASEDGYRSLEKGSYKVEIQTEEELKGLLELGLPIDTQIQVYGVKRIVTENDRPYVNTVTSRAYYVSNGKKVALNGIATQKLTVLNSFTAIADKEQVVIDYGKAIRIALNTIKDNIHLNENVTADFYGITKSGTHNQIRMSAAGITGIAVDTAYKTATSNGTYYLRNIGGEIDTVEFKLDEMLSEVEKVYAAYKITDAALSDTEYKEYYLLVELDIIPATNVYYETDFADGVFTFADSSSNTNTWSIVSEGTEVEDPVQDFKAIGTDLYGFDSTYTDDTKYSDFDSWKVTGAGNNVTTVNFSFTGTGFDIISQTGEKEGIIRASIYSDAAKTNLVKRVQVLNKSESELTLYQIPVISVEGLEYGTYYVNIGVSQPKTDSSIAALNNGGQFHFDAIRIFDPIDVSLAESSTGDALIAYQAYAGDGEANATRYEVRNLLIAANDYDADAGTEGITFVDRFYNSEGIEGVNVTDYAAIGPNNEVYLTRGQAIAFKIQTDRMPASIDLGLKSANGEIAIAKTTLSSGITKEYTNIPRTITIGSSTTLYYDLADGASAEELFVYNDEAGCYETYVIVTNDSAEDSISILSITDLKFGYGLNVQPLMMRFMVARDVMAAADTFMLDQTVEEEEEVYVPKDNILDAKFTSKDCRVNKKTTMTVTTTKDVERIEVLNAYGNDECTKIKYKDSKRGTRTWTVELIPLHVGKQTYKVVGYEADGIAGAEVTVSIDVRAPKNILDAKFTSKDCRVNKKTTMTVTTTKKVKRIEVLNAYGDDECTKIKQKDSKDGKRTWTVELTPSHVGKQTYKVVGYEANDTAGAEVTVSINVKKK